MAAPVTSLGNFVVGVKNTFVNVEEPSNSNVRRRRMKTVPRDFGSELHDGTDEDVASTFSEVGSEADVTSSSSSLQPSALTDRVWSLSQDAAGCREVQEALADEALQEEQREALAT